MASRAGFWLILLALGVGPAIAVHAQTLRYSNHREVQEPPDALLRIGPFYSSMTFSQLAGYRWTQGTGAGMDFLEANHRGVIKEDGQDIPLISTLSTRNYLLVTRRMDVDLSVNISYACYPLNTQNNAFNVDLPPEGVDAMFSTEFQPSDFVKGNVADSLVYRTDYVDTRGISDRYGGQEYKYLSNDMGVNMDWLMAPDRNSALSLSRADYWPQTREFEGQRRTGYAESLAYEQRVSDSTVAGLKAAFGQTDYDSADRADFSSQEYSIFGNAKVTDKTTGSASVGYSLATVSAPDTASDEGSSTIVGGLSLKTEIMAGLSHSLSYNRSMRAAFASAYEVSDTAAYNLSWTYDELITGFQTGYGKYQPSSDAVPGYSNWRTSLNLSYPLVEFARLVFDTSYDIRANDRVAAGEAVDAEWLADYSTWSSRIGTTFKVFHDAQGFDDVDFGTYFQHVQRFSDSADLQYEREIFEANLTYIHKF